MNYWLVNDRKLNWIKFHKHEHIFILNQMAKINKSGWNIEITTAHKYGLWLLLLLLSLETITTMKYNRHRHTNDTHAHTRTQTNRNHESSKLKCLIMAVMKKKYPKQLDTCLMYYQWPKRWTEAIFYYFKTCYCNHCNGAGVAAKSRCRWLA